MVFHKVGKGERNVYKRTAYFLYHVEREVHHFKEMDSLTSLSIKLWAINQMV